MPYDRKWKTATMKATATAAAVTQITGAETAAGGGRAAGEVGVKGGVEEEEEK